MNYESLKTWYLSQPIGLRLVIGVFAIIALVSIANALVGVAL